MATTYEWVISALDTAPTEGELSNVVKTIHWRLQASNETHTADVYGSVGVDEPAAESFVAFDSLTKETVEAWLEAKLDVDALKEGLDSQLAALAAPAIVSKAAPWTQDPVVA